MALTEQSRVRFFRTLSDKSIVDTGWDLVQYDGHGEMWEPADTVLARGANGTGKTWTGINFVDDTAGQPIRGNVFYPRTGTAA